MKKRTRQKFGKKVDTQNKEEKQQKKENKKDKKDFRKKLKVVTNNQFDKKMAIYFEERRAQEADEKRKLDYLKVIDKVYNER